MALENDFLPFATAGGANVITQATYSAASYVSTGRSSGILPSNVYNKISRQSSIGTYLLAQIVNDILGVNALDNGDLVTLLANVKASITALAFSTGDLKPTIKTVADFGWLLLNDGTIGSGSSGAGYQNADAINLFELIYNNLTDSFSPIFTQGGAGTTRAAQVNAVNAWNANCRITLPLALSRVLGVAGQGAGLSLRSLGQTVGEEAHTLTPSETPPTGVAATDSTNFGGQFAAVIGVGFSGATVAAHNTMQPTTFVNWMIKK